MKCPDCGSRLSDLMLGGLLGFRCYKCGGFWVDSKVVNNLEPYVLQTMRRIKIDPVWLSGGKGVCPQDGTMLQNYNGEQVPGYLHVKRCVRCGKWWFAGDALFEYKALQTGGEKMYYSERTDMNKYVGVVLPVVGLLVLGTGLGVAVNLSMQRNQFKTSASENLIRVDYMTNGVLQVVTENGVAPEFVEYRPWGVDAEWVRVEGGTIRGLSEGQTYEVKVGEKIVNVIAI